MNRPRTIVVGLMLCAAGAMSGACDSPTEPTEDSVRLVGQISQAVIPPRGTATLTFRLENISDDSITLRFSSGCQILPYITSRPDGRIVHPPGGAWGCPAVISELMLRPGQVELREVIVQASAVAEPPNVGLMAGEYSAYARVEAMGVEVESAPVLFTVQ